MKAEWQRNLAGNTSHTHLVIIVNVEMQFTIIARVGREGWLAEFEPLVDRLFLAHALLDDVRQLNLYCTNSLSGTCRSGLWRSKPVVSTLAVALENTLTITAYSSASFSSSLLT